MKKLPHITTVAKLRAIASSDLHNLVYRGDYRMVPAATANHAAILLAHGAKAT